LRALPFRSQICSGKNTFRTKIILQDLSSPFWEIKSVSVYLMLDVSSFLQFVSKRNFWHLAVLVIEKVAQQSGIVAIKLVWKMTK
jgi:hypothetical protein